MKKMYLLACTMLFGLAVVAQEKKTGNPVFEGWYADPEGAIWGKTYWIYPTSSLPFDDQTYMDAFSSKDLVTWKKHSNILDTCNVKWATRALWAPSIVKKRKK